MVRGIKSPNLLLQIIKQRTVENVRTLISKPSHSFLIVTMPVFVVVPLTISLTVDCVIPEMLLILLIVMFRSLHSSSSRFTVASAIVIQSSSYRNAVNKSVSKMPEKR